MSTVIQEKEIDGYVFRVTQLPAMKSLRMFARLGKLFGPAITKGLAGMDIKDLSKLDVGLLGAAFGELFTSVSENDLESLTRDLLAATTIDNVLLLPVIDLKLQGQPLTILKLLAFALEVNYKSFFDAARALGASRAAPSTSTSPTP